MHTMTIVARGTTLGDIWQCGSCERRIAIDGGRAIPVVIREGDKRVSHVSGETG